MKRRLKLARSRLLGFRLSREPGQQQNNDVRAGAKVGKPTIDVRTGAKIGKTPGRRARAGFDARIGAKIGKTTSPGLRS
jgi:hypothetical protein